MRGAMGSEPSRGNRSFGSPALFQDFYQRRPTTRMGVEWALRKAFYEDLPDDFAGLPLDDRKALIAAIRSPKASPLNARSPVKHSYSTQPKAQMSARLSSG